MTFNPASVGSRRKRQESASASAVRVELVELLQRRTGSDGRHETAIPQLRLYRFSYPTEPLYVLQEPAVYIVVQGRKQVTVGNKTYIYDPSQYLAVSVDLPAVGNVVEASPKAPYLCMTLTVDPRELAALIVEASRSAPDTGYDPRALYLSPLRTPLLDGFLRLIRLLDTPQDIAVLAPLILRELHYRLLQSEQFGRLAQMAIGDGRLRRVSGDSLDQRALRGTVSSRGACEAGSYEPFHIAWPLQGGRSNEPDPVPEAAASAGGSALVANRPDERGTRRL